MVINIRKKASELKIESPDLITRPVGRDIYELVSSILKGIKDGELVILDFNEIKVIDSSFIDEFLVKLIIDARESKLKYYIKLKNISHIAEINIDLVFKSYSNYKNEKIVVLTDDIRLNNSFFIGPLSDREKDVIEYLRVNRSVSEQDLYKYIGLPPNESGTIMQNLAAMRIVRDEGSGFYSAL